MFARIAGKAGALLLCLSLFSTCGELDTLFPSNGSYQVRTMVNGSSLEDCSIVRSNDKIRPYFAVSVVNDPDLIGLLVYLQDSQGKIVGERVQYTLEQYAQEAPQKTKTETETETKIEEEESELEQTEDPDPEEAEIVGETAISKKTGEDEADKIDKIDEIDETDEIDEDEIDETGETDEENDRIARELPEYGAVREKWSFTDTKPVVQTADKEIVVKSFAEHLPYFPLPKNLEIGPYTLVFEALGKRETLSRTETYILYLGNAAFNFKDVSVYLPGLSGSQLISPGTTVMLEAGLDFDSRLDPYVIWYNGRNIISAGKISEGAGNILWKAPEQIGFYSLRLEAFPFYLKQRNNFTGVSREIALPVSPKAVSLGYFFENNPEYSARSPLAAGTAYPEQIELIAAMAALAAATPPEDADDTETTEKEPPPVPPSPPKLLHWYQFEGSLRNTVPVTGASTLLPAAETSPRWAAAGQSYGLSVGSGDSYLLSPVNFFRKEQDQGGGILLLHISPPTEGVIFRVFFPLRSSATDGVWMDMVKERNIVALRLNAGDATVEMPVYLVSSGPGLIPIVVEFYIRPYRLEAKISLDGYFQNSAGSVPLSGALSGEGRIRLGGVFDKSDFDTSKLENAVLANLELELEKRKIENTVLENSRPDAPVTSASATSTRSLTESSFDEIVDMIAIPDSAEKPDTGPAKVEIFTASTIWDELAILFSEVPLVQEELLTAAVTEQDETDLQADKRKAERPSINDQGSSVKPAVAYPPPPPPDSGAGSGSAEAGNIETRETQEDEKVTPPAGVVTDTDDSIQEHETQERKTPAIPAENS